MPAAFFGFSLIGMRQNDTSQTSTIIDQLKQRKTYLDTTEVMGILGVTRATLCGWAKSGNLPAVRIGKGNKYDPSVLSHWLQSRAF